jgi:hypothetical protein
MSSANRTGRNGSTKSELMTFTGLLIGWAFLQAFFLPKTSGS